MKKIFSAILCVIMILGCTSVAFATGWGKLEENDTTCENYNINLYKLERVVGVMGEAFKVVPDATAKVGDVVYFTGYALGENAINAMILAFTEEDYVLTDLANIKAEGSITTDDLGGVMLPVFSARVTGNNPNVSVTIKSGNDVMKCFYKGQPVVASKDAREVTLGEYKFIRDELNVVTEVWYNGVQITPVMSKEEWDKSTAGLVELGITMDAVKARQIYMSNEHLVRNFSNYKEITKIITWGVNTAVVPINPALPQTGDMSTLTIALMAIFAAVIIIGVRKINVH